MVNYVCIKKITRVFNHFEIKQIIAQANEN